MNIDNISLKGTGNEFDPSSGNLTINTQNVFTNGNNLNIFGAKTLTISNTGGSGITGTGGLTLNSIFTGTTILSGSNNYTGATSINGGKLQINSGGSTAAGSAVTVSATGAGALTINSGGTVGGNVTVNPSSAAGTSNLSNSGTISGTLTIKSSTVPAPIAAQGNAVISGNATLNAGSTTGAILNDGQLTIAGATSVTTGTISSTGTGSGASAGTGAVFVTNSGGSNLTFAAGSSFARIAPGNGGVVNITSLGTTSAYSYGQNNGSNTISQPFTANFNGGTFNIGQAGQNNSGAFTAGTTNILGGTVFNLASIAANGWSGIASASNGGSFMHGTWNVGGATSGTLAVTGGLSEGGGVATVPVGTAINGLQINVGNGGTLSTTTATGLGFANTTTAQAAGQTTAQTTNSVTVNSGGTATTAGNFTLANTGIAQTAITTFNTLTVNTGATFSNSGGVLYIGNQNLANTQLETNTVNVAGGTLNQAGGAVSLGASNTTATNYANILNVSSGTMNVGTSASNQAFQLGTASNTAATVSNTANLSGGKLIVSGQISALAGTGQVNKFNWTGGQLTAGTVTATSATWAAAAGGGIAGGILNNTGGTFAPGDIGTGGKTTVTGGYTQGASGTLAIDLGSTAIATAFQSGLAFYDTIAMTGALTLGGNLNVSLINGFGSTITSGNSFNIFTGATSVTGAFANVDAAGRVNLLTGGSIGVSNTSSTVTLSGYSNGASLIWAGNGGTNAWDVATTSDFTKGGVTSVFNTGDVATFNNSGIANNTVNLNTTVSPSLVTFAHTSGTYTVVGSGGIGGTGALNVQGGGTVVLDTVNGYNGTTTISSGTLQLGDGTTGHDGTISNSLSIVNSGSLVFNPFATSGLDYSGVISGAGSVTKTGAGTQIFSGTNTFSGPLSVQQGTLSIGSINNASANGVLGNSANSVSLGNTGGVTGTLAYTGATTSSTKKFTLATGGSGAFNVTTGATTLTLSGVIDGSGSLVNNGTGTLLLSGANTYSGGTTLSSGMLTLGASTTVTAGSIASGPLGTGTVTLSGGTLQDNGTTRTLANNVSIAGSVTFASTAATGITFNGTTNTVPATVTLNAANPTLTVNNTLQVNDVIQNGTGTTGFTKAGTGTLSLLGVSSFTGGVTVSNGTLLVGGTATNTGTTITGSATGTGNVSFSTGTSLNSAGGATWDVPTITLAGAGSMLNLIGGNRLIVNYNTLELGDTSRTGVTTVNVNSKGLPVTSGNTLSTESTGQWSWETNTALGTPTIQNGTLDLETTAFSGTSYGTFFIRGTNFTNADLTVGANVILGGNGTGAFGTSSTNSPKVTINTGGIINMLGTSKSVKSLSGGGSIFNSMVATNAANSTLTINGTTGSTDFSGVISNGPGSGALSLTKTGGSTQMLSGINTYTGATLIGAGTLALGSGGSIDNTSGVSLGTAGTFDVSAKSLGYTVGTFTGSGNVTGTLSVSTQLAIGNSPGTINFSGNLSLGSSSTFLYDMTGGVSPGLGSADLGDIAGNLTISTSSILDLVELGTYTAGNKFTLFAYDGTLTGNFSGLTNNSTFVDDLANPWLIRYNDSTAGLNGGVGNSYITITAIPEPNVAMLVGGLGVLALLRRSRI